jgi:hypothetical protein
LCLRDVAHWPEPLGGLKRTMNWKAVIYLIGGVMTAVLILAIVQLILL